MAETKNCKGTEIADAITNLGEESMEMLPHIREMLGMMADMREDIEDLAMNKEQELKGLSILDEMEKKVKLCLAGMEKLEKVDMKSPMEVTTKTITELETNSFEMFTRLTMLESLHIVPGLESLRVGQLAYWKKWQMAAASLKEIIMQFVKK